MTSPQGEKNTTKGLKPKVYFTPTRVSVQCA